MVSTSLPSCSTSASSSQVWNHDVFVSFRGEDTRYKFVDHLQTALQQRGICTYIDTELLRHGAPIVKTLLKAIQESRVVVVVFSKNYANSSFCMNELEDIVKNRIERDQIVLPIFYHVDPWDVRKQKGAYGVAFEAHKFRFNHKVESWRKALEEISNLTGWVLNKDLYRRESTCIIEVVDTISSKLLPDTGIVSRLQDQKLGIGDSSIMVPSRPSSCTPASSSKLRNHSVFLSYRGIDTGSNFVDHLYAALDQAEILTYMKEDTFPLDESLTPSHIKAIEESQIAVIIFSRNYAASSLCLDELAYIMECMVNSGKTVLPVYYDVSPSNVRYQRGEYEEAFGRHDHVMETNKVKYWRNQLAHASDLFGWEISDKHESKYIKLIVDTISKRLFPDEGFIGAQTRLEGLRYGGDGGGMAMLGCSREDAERLKIPLQDILLETKNFAKENVIAKGGFGEVYRGQTEQLGLVAIKRLIRMNNQGDRQFITEIDLLSTLKHENIVSLVGYCNEGSERILVYRYEKNGSLDKVLPRKDLTWIQCLKICLDAARGLEYIHDAVQHQYTIVHRDIKSSNILLDETWKAKISDFGLSRTSLASVRSVIFTGACGTLGYVDPLYKDNEMLTQKSDVYSFGIVMFEVLFGRLVNKDIKYFNDHYFSVRCAKDHYEKKTLDEIIDSNLRRQMNSDALVTFSSIAYQCMKKRREERPTMSQVVDQLEKALDYQQGSSGFLHDVYISFRDRDTESHIVDDIRADLDKEGISTYKDDVTQSRKEPILLKSIERSRLFVIVFTKKFAVNSWYLDEVAKITDCSKEKGQFILPIFYNVSSSDVRTQKGYFGEVMSEYDKHPRVEVWRKALVEATIAAGLEYSKFPCIADLVKKVVEEIKSCLSENDKKKANVLR